MPSLAARRGRPRPVGGRSAQWRRGDGRTWRMSSCFPQARARRVGRSYTRIGHGRPGAWNRVFWGPCLERVRASERLERDVRVAGPVRVGARGVGTRRSGVSTGRTWPRPTAGTMERIGKIAIIFSIYDIIFSTLKFSPLLFGNLRRGAAGRLDSSNPNADHSLRLK